MVGFGRDIVIFPRIWGRQPISNILLQLVTCEAVSVSLVNSGGIRI